MNWTSFRLATFKISPGSLIDFQPTGARATGLYPHRTEDTSIDAGSIRYFGAATVGWYNTLPVAATLNAAFAGRVRTTGEWNQARKGAYVPEGTQIASLSAMRLPFDHLEFYEDDYRGNKSLRAYLEDAEERYSLPVVARTQREAYRAHRARGINQTLPVRGFVHIRIGLARAWSGQPGRCTVMINGIYW
jgi:hypothetical protein